MNEYHENSGLTEYEWKLEQIIDKIRNEKSTLLAIKILEREIKQLNEETRKDFGKENCEVHETVLIRWAHKCKKCGKIFEGQ